MATPGLMLLAGAPRWWQPCSTRISLKVRIEESQSKTKSRTQIVSLLGGSEQREKKSRDTQRYVDKEDCLPTEPGDQNAAKRWTESSANLGHRAEQPYGERRGRVSRHAQRRILCPDANR